MTDHSSCQPCAIRGVRPYHRGMASSADPQRDAVDLNAGVDPQERAEARAWAKTALAEARERQTPEFWARLRAELGLAPRPAR